MDRNRVEKMFADAGWYGVPEKDVLAFMYSLTDDEPYILGPDSLPQEGVPVGTITEHEMVSAIYPNSMHRYRIYVPAQYDAKKETPIMVFLDGITQYLRRKVNTPVVLDNLIAAGKIPVMLALFLEPGDNGDGEPVYGGSFIGPVSNRSKEYDSIDDIFARFLDEEILPEIQKNYNITSKPEGRGICGASSGAIAAFNAAWHHTHSFRKVICHIPSFTDIRGGHNVPVIVRKNPRKPIRVLLQDGEKDLNTSQGDWVLSNKQMVSALEYREYDYKYVFGVGGHTMYHGASILPESLCWLWRDYTK